MPQDPLTQQLMSRAMQGETPLPETLSPEQQAQQDSSPLSGLRKPFEHGMDFMLSAAGLRQPRVGSWSTGLGALAGVMAGAPKLPFGALAGAVKNGQTAMEGAGELSPLLKRIFAANPDAERVYSEAMATQVPKALEARQAAGSARYGIQANAHDALLDLEHAGRPRPIPTDTGFATAIPLKRPGALATPQIGQTKSLSLSNLTPEIIKDIQTGDPATVSRRYPDINPPLLQKIMNGTVNVGGR